MGSNKGDNIFINALTAQERREKMKKRRRSFLIFSMKRTGDFGEDSIT
jgi:hypothetical protein